MQCQLSRNGDWRLALPPLFFVASLLRPQVRKASRCPSFPDHQDQSGFSFCRGLLGFALLSSRPEPVPGPRSSFLLTYYYACTWGAITLIGEDQVFPDLTVSFSLRPFVRWIVGSVGLSIIWDSESASTT